MPSMYELQENIQEIIDDEIEEALTLAKEKILERTTSLLSILISKEKTVEFKKELNDGEENNTVKCDIRTMFDMYKKELANLSVEDKEDDDKEDDGKEDDDKEDADKEDDDKEDDDKEDADKEENEEIDDNDKEDDKVENKICEVVSTFEPGLPNPARQRQLNQEVDEDDDMSVFEIEVDDETYYVSDEEPNNIFEKLSDGSIGDWIGIFKDENAYLQSIYKGKKVYYCHKKLLYYEFINDTTIGDIIN